MLKCWDQAHHYVATIRSDDRDSCCKQELSQGVSAQQVRSPFVIQGVFKPSKSVNASCKGRRKLF